MHLFLLPTHSFIKQSSSQCSENKNAHIYSSAPIIYLNDLREEKNSIKQLLPILGGVSPSTGTLGILM